MKENLLPKGFEKFIRINDTITYSLIKVNSFRHARTDVIINGQKYFYKLEINEIEKPSFVNVKETLLQKVKKMI